MKIKNSLLLISILSSFYLSILILFPSSVPFVDDWSVFENLIIKDNDILKWLFIETEGGHNFAIIKILLIIIYYLSNFNLEIFNFLSIFSIFLASLFFVKKLNKDKIQDYLICWFILFIFSGKFFPAISQMVNYSWIFTYLMIIIFWYNFHSTKKNISIILITTILAPLSLGFGLVIPFYLIIFTLIKVIEKKSETYDYIFFTFSIFVITITYLLPQIHNQSQTILNDLDLNNLINFFITFFSILGNIFVPWVPKLSLFVYISAFFGFIQIICILIIFLRELKINKHNNFSDLYADNPLLFMGIFFAGLVSIKRYDFLTGIEARYFAGCLIFQLGFWIMILKNNYRETLVNTFKFISIYCFIISLFSPYLGIHWQISKSIQSKQIINCYNNNIMSIEECHKETYTKVFYNSDWYDINSFNESISYLYMNNKSFFNKLDKKIK